MCGGIEFDQGGTGEADKALLLRVTCKQSRGNFY